MQDWRPVLKSEFDAEDGSFLIQVRGNLKWDNEAFLRLITAMKACCLETKDLQSLERWQANGFWYFSTTVRDWTAHSNFPKLYSAEYYQRAYLILDELAYWFFFGEQPTLDDEYDFALPE